MANIKSVNREICEISGTTTCTSLVHRQIRELKSRWQMRWAALEETISSECEYRKGLQSSLEHIVCKAKSARKSMNNQRHDDPTWMEIRISSWLIRSFLRAVWPDPEVVNEWTYEVMTLDSYYGEKLKYLPPDDDSGTTAAVKEPDNDMSSSTQVSSLVTETHQGNASSTDDIESRQASVSEVHTTLNTDSIPIPELDQSISSIETQSASGSFTTSSASGLMPRIPSTAQLIQGEQPRVDDASVTDPYESLRVFESLVLSQTDTQIETLEAAQTKERLQTSTRDPHPIELDMVASLSEFEEDTIRTLENSKSSQEAPSDDSLPAQVDIAALDWYKIPPAQRHAMDGVYPWTLNPQQNGLSSPKRLKELVDRSNTVMTSISGFDHFTRVNSIVAGDYNIVAMTRTEANFTIYEARALFHGQQTYILTAIRSPQDPVEYRRRTMEMLDVQRERLQALFLEAERECDATKQILDEEASDTTEKATHAQRKYIIKLIKKRQASETYLDMFLFEGIIWTVQSQSRKETQSTSNETCLKPPPKKRPPKHSKSPEKPSKTKDLPQKSTQSTSNKNTPSPSHPSEPTDLGAGHDYLQQLNEAVPDSRMRETLARIFEETQAQLNPEPTVSSMESKPRRQTKGTDSTHTDSTATQEKAKAKKKRWKPKNQRDHKDKKLSSKLEQSGTSGTRESETRITDAGNVVVDVDFDSATPDREMVRLGAAGKKTGVWYRERKAKGLDPIPDDEVESCPVQ